MQSKTVTLNAYMIISMIATLVSFGQGANTNSTVGLIFTAIGMATSCILVGWFPNGNWAGDKWTKTVFAFNAVAMVSLILTNYINANLFGGTFNYYAGIVVGAINIILRYAGTIKQA